MSKRIFHAIWLVALAVFLASLVFIMSVTYSYFSGVQRSQLKIETQLAAQGVGLEGMEYFDGLSFDGYRITWIDRNGTVLFDNEADSDEMENHLEREEVRQAFENGYGESSRYSLTLSERLLYSAKRLPDGSVLRLSSVQDTLWMLLLGFAQPIAIVILIALGLSLFLASRLSKKIVAPINRIDPDRPTDYLDNSEYEEVAPLLRRMNLQQNQIRKDRAELEKTSRIRQEFTANASHELKTPLQTISGYAELLQNGLVKSEDILPFAGRIRSEAQRMAQLVGDIIDLTRLDGGADGMQWEDTDLLLVAQNALDSLQSEADAKGVALSLSGSSAVVHGLPHVLHSIVYNLCDNAIKYNRPQGSVAVNVMHKAGSVLLTVADTGIGIPEEHHTRIFERFYRVDKSHSREIGGTGLGLSIVKHGVLVHNASITINSRPGEGTTFTVIFPTE